MNNLIGLKLVGWTLVTSGVWWILGLVFVTLFYIVGQPFGALSDFSSALSVVLMLPFVFEMHRKNNQEAGILSLIALVAGIMGILMVAIASIMIILGTINFKQSLPPVLGGYASIGVWMFITGLILRANSSYPPKMITWEIVIGLGLASIGLLLTALSPDPGVISNWKTIWTNPLIYPSFILVPVGYLSYPIWVFWVGRMFLEGKIMLAAT